MKAVMRRANWSRRWVSGVTNSATPATMAPIFPISVARAVATTTPLAWPTVTTVPA